MKLILVEEDACYGKNNSKSGKEKNIQLVTAALTGIEIFGRYADFELGEAKNIFPTICQCMGCGGTKFLLAAKQ